MDELNGTMGNVEVAMDGLGEEFELLKNDLKWEIVLFVVTVTVVVLLL